MGTESLFCDGWAGESHNVSTGSQFSLVLCVFFPDESGHNRLAAGELGGCVCVNHCMPSVTQSYVIVRSY